MRDGETPIARTSSVSTYRAKPSYAKITNAASRATLPALTGKLKQGDAPSTVVAPYWPSKPWYMDMYNLSNDILHFPPSSDLFFPGRLGTRIWVGQPKWSIAIF
jgi:hypothetical protein